MVKISRSRISKLYQEILGRLPSSYPQAQLIIHTSLKDLRKCYTNSDEITIDLPYAYCDAQDLTIHVSTAFYNDTIETMSYYFLHEIGHLYSLKFGESDPRWDDYDLAERYANGFAARWLKRLEKEDWFGKVKEKIKKGVS